MKKDLTLADYLKYCEMNIEDSLEQVSKSWKMYKENVKIPAGFEAECPHCKKISTFVPKAAFIERSQKGE